MVTIEEAARDYGVTVERVPDADFTVKHFELTGESVACVLWFRIVNKQNQAIPGVRLMTTNGGEILTNPSKEDGYTDVGMGGGSAYFPKEGQSGPHSAWIYDAASDIVRGLGWDGSTDHQSLITIWEGEGGIEMPYELKGCGDYNLHDHFRNAGVTVYEDTKYGVTELWCRSGEKDDKPFPFEVTVRKKSGDAAVGKVIKLKKDGGESGAWDYITDETGCAVIYMDESYKYAVPGNTHYSVQIGKGDGGSDVVAFGWVAGQRRWFDVVFQARGGEPQLPGKPVFSNPRVSATEFYIEVESAGADLIHYTLDGPEHIEGETEGSVYEAGLEPDTPYYFKAWGTNDAGGGPDEFYEFMTLEGTVPDPVQNLHISYRTSTSLSLAWQSNAYTFKVQTPQGEFIISEKSYDSMGLEPETVYGYLVSAGNEAGWSDPVEIVGETLPESTGECSCKAELDEVNKNLNIIINELKRLEGGCTCT